MGTAIDGLHFLYVRASVLTRTEGHGSDLYPEEVAKLGLF